MIPPLRFALLLSIFPLLPALAQPATPSPTVWPWGAEIDESVIASGGVTLVVDAQAKPGGDGSAARPFTTVAEGVNAALAARASLSSKFEQGAAGIALAVRLPTRVHLSPFLLGNLLGVSASDLVLPTAFPMTITTPASTPASPNTTPTSSPPPSAATPPPRSRPSGRASSSPTTSTTTRSPPSALPPPATWTRKNSTPGSATSSAPRATTSSAAKACSP